MRKLKSFGSKASGRRQALQRAIEHLEPRTLLSTVLVNSPSDSATPTAGMLRYAITHAADGDVIQFDPTVFTAGSSRTITLASGLPLAITKNITIQGPTNATVAISGNKDTGITGNVFTIDSAVTAAEIDNLTITKGNMVGGNGGGIDNEGVLTLNNDLITNNAASGGNGGGIYSANGTTTVTNSRFTNNTAGFGGGIYELGGTLSISGSLITGNTAPNGYGGGINNSGGAMTLSNSTLSNNSADSGSASPSAGGGLFNSGPATITGSTLTANSASNGTGGGIYSTGIGLNVINSTLANNAAGGTSGEGGGISADSYVVFTNSTIAYNSAVYGGGINIGFGDVTLYNSIIARNTATSGNNFGHLNFGSAFVDYDYSIPMAQPAGPSPSSNNLVDDNSGGMTNGVHGNILGADAKISTLADNGGPTQTIMPLTGSPAIDAGSNALATDENNIPLTTDQRGPGYVRIFNGTVDIGSVEVQTPAAPASLQATAGADQVSLSWPAVAGATSYKIYRGTTTGGESTTPLATVSGTSYLDTAVTAGTPYYYKVTAVSTLGESSASPEATATPFLPIIAGTVGNDSITLVQDADHLHVDWTMGASNGQVLISDPNGLTINGNGGTDTISLNYGSGTPADPLPAALHLSGTFNLNGLSGTSPLAGHTLEIGKSTVFIGYPVGQSPLPLIQQYLRTGYNGGAWNGTGTAGVITSAAAAANPKYAIGYADSADGTGINPNANTVELKYTLSGDANLDGSVNGADLSRLLGRYNQASGQDWVHGDFNYDFAVNGADLSKLLGNYNQTAVTSIAAPQSASSDLTPLGSKNKTLAKTIVR